MSKVAVFCKSYQRAHAIGIIDGLLVMECDRCGTQYGDRTPMKERFLRYWGKDGSGVAVFCRKCDPREWRAAQRRKIAHPGDQPLVPLKTLTPTSTKGA